MYGMGRPVSDGRNGPVWPTCKGHAEFDAFGEQRVIVPVRGRQPPQPRHHPQPDEAVVAHPSAQLADGVHRSVQVDGGQPGQSARMSPNPAGHFVVGDEVEPVRAAPGTEQADIDADAIHRRQGRLDRQVDVGNRPARPSPQRGEYVVGEETWGGMLHPDVDRHRDSTVAAPSTSRSR